VDVKPSKAGYVFPPDTEWQNFSLLSRNFAHMSQRNGKTFHF
jgi:hypothetical protein